jgi:tetratricopeptide (TPR) repeat protein
VKEAHTPFTELNQTDLEEEIILYRKSLSLCPTSHPNRSSSLASLASALQVYSRITGSMTALEEAISMHREILSLCPTPHPDRFPSLNNLANTLLNRFTMEGSMADLEKAFHYIVNHYSHVHQLI